MSASVTAGAIVSLLAKEPYTIGAATLERLNSTADVHPNRIAMIETARLRGNDVFSIRIGIPPFGARKKA
jgi:hypothetical protein